MTVRRPWHDDTGVAFCSHAVCPKYVAAGKSGPICIETERPPDAVCIPAVRDLIVKVGTLKAALRGACDIASPCIDTGYGNSDRERIVTLRTEAE